MPKEFQQKKTVCLKMMLHRRQHHHRRCVCVVHPVTTANNIGMDEGNGSGTGMEMLQGKDLSSMDALV